MLIQIIWNEFLYGYCWGYKYTSCTRIFICLILSILVLPIELLLSPLEIISLIIYFLIPKDTK